jgi:tetratricopeptide (TPR) repeat protein/tRNA A-37 threonylcarbamoyl transferase component Bud32
LERTLTTPPHAPGQGSAVPTFAANDLVAGRYRIVRFLASGGMGDVFEAEDLDLKERLALKTIRPEIAERPGTLDRFKREIQLARKVTHPNVCRMFDLGYHVTPSQQRISFLTMELLGGETLAHRLERGGRLTTREALPLAEQMAAALAAAHQARIIHRDFKTANVMLVPSGGSLRVVVTDFGLALADDGERSRITGAGLMGTPAYMAPEQLEGEEVTPATDIYSLGIVLYETVTGARPFAGNTPFAEAARKLQEDPTPARNYLPDIDLRWERTIRQCLARSPHRRPASAVEIPRLLGGTPAKRRRWVWLAAPLLGALVALTAFALRRAEVPAAAPAPQAVPAAPRRGVAVVGFRDLGQASRQRWLPTALSEMLITELALSETLRLVSGDAIARAKRDLAPSADLGAEALSRIGAYLGADLLIVGQYLLVGNGAKEEIRLDLRIQRAQDGEILASVTETGAGRAILDLVSRVGRRVREKLGVGGRTAQRPLFRPSPKATELYAQGLDAMRSFDALAARDLFQRAVQEDSSFALAYAGLAQAWSLLGYDARAQTASERAFELSGGLGKEQRLLIEARYRELRGELGAAVEIYRKLWGFLSDNLEYGLYLVSAQSRAGQGREALATLGALRALPAPSGEDPRIDYEASQAARAMGDSRARQAAAARAAERAAARGQRLTVALARETEAWALFYLGDPARAVASFEESERVASALGNRSLLARARYGAAFVRFQQGEVEEGKRRCESALQIWREIGDKAGVAEGLASLAYIHLEQGDLTRTWARCDEALRVIDEIGDNVERGAIFFYRGCVSHQRGDLPRAIRDYRTSRDLYARRGHRHGQVFGFWGETLALLDQGALATARERFEEGLSAARSTGNLMYSVYFLLGEASALRARGLLAQARAKEEEGLSIRLAYQHGRAVAESRLRLAELSLDEKRFGEAAAQSHEAAAAFAHQSAPFKEAAARAVLARAYLALGDLAGARAEMRKAEALLAPQAGFAYRLDVALHGACVLSASGTEPDRARARQRLAAMEAEAARMGVADFTLRARFERARMEPAAAGRARSLSVLEHDASAKGFDLIARWAAAAKRARVDCGSERTPR